MTLYRVLRQYMGRNWVIWEAPENFGTSDRMVAFREEGRNAEEKKLVMEFTTSSPRHSKLPWKIPRGWHSSHLLSNLSRASVATSLHEPASRGENPKQAVRWGSKHRLEVSDGVITYSKRVCNPITSARHKAPYGIVVSSNLTHPMKEGITISGANLSLLGMWLG